MDHTSKMKAGKKIAIIGGGLSGSASVNMLKEEGFEPVAFEARDGYLGTWYYREESEVGYASVMPTTVLNNSKEISAFSEHPPRKENNIYMRQSEAFEYFTMIKEKFEIGKYGQYNTEVMHVKKSEDYDETGRFIVTVKDKISGRISSDIYDGVMVCTGHFSIPNMVHFRGQEKFKGNIIHTHSMKSAEKFKGQNVLVIGSGCSGLDAADAASSVAKQVYLSSRSGMFVLSRLGPYGYPSDYLIFRRYLNFLLKHSPTKLASWYIETFYLDVKFDHNLYRVKPTYHFLQKDPILNDVIFPKLHSGSIVQRGAVKYFTENGVVFEGESKVTEIDTVILATGYKWSFPFLEEGLLEIENGRINLYKCMYPVQLPHPTLVFIGFFNSIGPGIPVGELQCRWAAQVFAGKCKLPSKQAMLHDTIKRHEKNLSRYTPSEYLSIRVDVMEFSDELASQFGAQPNIIKYLFTDFPLFLKLVFGPFLPYQYRLDGPHKWDGAREAIMTAHDRVVWPLTRGKRIEKSILQFIFEFIGNLIPRNIFI